MRHLPTPCSSPEDCVDEWRGDGGLVTGQRRPGRAPERPQLFRSGTLQWQRAAALRALRPRDLRAMRLCVWECGVVVQAVGEKGRRETFGWLVQFVRVIGTADVAPGTTKSVKIASAPGGVEHDVLVARVRDVFVQILRAARGTGRRACVRRADCGWRVSCRDQQVPVRAERGGLHAGRRLIPHGAASLRCATRAIGRAGEG
jgi:hypothetical protein